MPSQLVVLRVERLRDHLGEPQPFGDLERELDALPGELVLSDEVLDPAELLREHGEVGIGRVLREDRERSLHQLDGLGGVALVPHRLCEP